MIDKNSENDAKYMRLALKEAEKGIGLTSPNPTVGCVIVKKGKIIGRGYHRKSGGPHAEIEAIRSAKGKPLKGATIYITLEPCSTYGKTPPCVEAIIKSQMARVVYGVKDPDFRHQDKAKKLLKKKGIQVTSEILFKDCQRIIRPFAKRVQTGLPWVIVKAGMSLDGRLTRPGMEGQWITNEQSLKDVQRLRAEVDAIIVGATTLKKDDPSLTIRDTILLKKRKDQPKRVVLRRKSKLSKTSKIFTDQFKNNNLIYSNKSLKAVLKDLAKRHQCNSVMIEGGGKLIGDAFKRELVDELCLYYAPIICGEKCKPLADAALKASSHLSEVSFKSFGDNYRVRGLVNTKK